MDKDVIYLKIKPDTFSLSAKQFYHITTCQFCGNDDRFVFRKLLSKNKNIKWIQKCSDCHQTVAAVLSDETLA